MRILIVYCPNLYKEGILTSYEPKDYSTKQPPSTQTLPLPACRREASPPPRFPPWLVGPHASRAGAPRL
jgi:hypothetical protein